MSELEQRAFEDLDEIAETAEEGINALRRGNPKEARSALASIKGRAESWEDRHE